MDYYKEAIKIHEEKKGKIEIVSKLALNDKDDLSIAYTPGVAEPCRKIHKNRDDVYKYTAKGNLVAVVSDGSAVLGLGNIGSEAAIPVMEGKSILFKEFANIDAFPICLDTQNTEEIINTVKYLAPVFGGINLEDISAPRCFEIEKRLEEELNIPVFHDDQHGTAIVTTAALINALKLNNKKADKIKIVVNGAGSAGVAIIRMLLKLGVKDIIACDSKGIIEKSRNDLSREKLKLLEVTNKENIKGLLKDALVKSDVFIGVSAPNVVTKDMVSTMNENAIIFAMSNPVPEIMPEDAKNEGAKIIGTGRSDYPNQINNVLAFPGIFRGALDAKASKINDEMKLAAAYAIASIIKEEELKEDYIIPNPFDRRVVEFVAKAVQDAAVRTGVSRV